MAKLNRKENFMSTNQLDNYTEREAKNLLNDICNAFTIGGKARTPNVVLTNVKNSVSNNAVLRGAIKMLHESGHLSVPSEDHLAYDVIAEILELGEVDDDCCGSCEDSECCSGC